MNTNKFSMLTLERYRLGELNAEDQKAVDEELAADEKLRLSLEKLDESDRELRLKYPFAAITEPGQKGLKIRRFAGRKTAKTRFRITGIAAVLMACILLPIIYYTRTMPGSSNFPTDRAKGAGRNDFELSLYLKGNEESPLTDSTLLGEGDTVQLAYRIPDGEQYGVIFSIDGRLEVTMHYPYRRGQSSELVSGRRTFLNEAYTLDDAPYYEVFVFVVSARPLDVESVMREAGTIARNINIADIIEQSRVAFKDYEVDILTMFKK